MSALPQWPADELEVALLRLAHERRCLVMHFEEDMFDPRDSGTIECVRWQYPKAGAYIAELEALLRQEADDVGADDALEALTRACLDDPKLGERVMAHLADLVANEDSATENDEGVAR